MGNITGEKYLSDLVSIEMLVKDKLNIIQAPTGSGKTYFALNAIPAACKDAHHKVVYLIDTINGKEQILNNYKAIREYKTWRATVSEEALWFEKDERIVVMTYARFGMIIAKELDFHKHFDYIICDELHSLLKFQNFSAKPNSHSIAKAGLEAAVRNTNTVVVALSATPWTIKEGFKVPSYEIPVDQDLVRHYEAFNVENYTDLEYLLSTLDPKDIGICYVPHITTMKYLIEKAQQLGIRALGIWSVNNTDHHMDEEQMKVRKHILENFELLPDVHLLFINSSSETSIKIKSHVDYVIVHHTDYATQVQVRGRVNSDLSRLYLPQTDPHALTIPDDYLGIRLFTPDKNRLCAIINQRNRYNRPYKWPTVKGMLIDSGYQIVEGREKNKHYALITKES